MSEQNTEEAPEATEETDAPEESQAGDVDADDGDSQDDWRTNFNADTAAKRIQKLQSEAKNLRERAKAAEQKAQGADEKDTKITDLERQNLRYEVGLDLGLPKQLISRLSGSSREELIADAEELVKLIGSPAKPASRKPVEALRGGGEPEQEPEETDLDKIGSRMFRR